jgi:hypothetical protein
MENYLYETDGDAYQDPFHSELKRDTSAHSRETEEETSNLPVFEVYQFLSPGPFLAPSAN